MFSLMNIDVLCKAPMDGINFKKLNWELDDLKSTGNGMILNPCFSNKYLDLFIWKAEVTSIIEELFGISFVTAILSS